MPVSGYEMEIMKNYHLSIGHSGTKTTKYHILRRYIWKNASKDIDKYVRECEICTIKLANRREFRCNVLKTKHGREKYEVDLIGPYIVPLREGLYTDSF